MTTPILSPATHTAKATLPALAEEVASAVVKEEEVVDWAAFVTPVLFSFSQQEVTKTAPPEKALAATLQKTIPFTFGGRGEGG